MTQVSLERHPAQLLGSTITGLVRPTSLRETLALLVEETGAHPVAGGTDLLLELQRGGAAADAQGASEPVLLVDLTSIADFDQVLESNSSFLIGGGVTHNQIVGNQSLQAHALPLAQACLEIGSPQLRNRATLAGNVATASPANDSISALMALRAEVVLEHWDGAGVARRVVPIEDFFVGVRQTVAEPHELITEIHVPKLTPTQRGIWVKVGLRRAQAISVVHAGMVVDLDDDGTVTEARLALGSVGPTVFTSDGFTDALVGRLLDDDSISAAAHAATADASPIGDLRATADYRVDAITTAVDRSLRALADGTQASMWPDRPPVLASERPVTIAAQSQRVQSPRAPSQTLTDGPMNATVNGIETSAPGATLTLLDWLRSVGNDGVKEGCAEGECGACTVLLNGAAVMSCLVPAGQADGAEVTTVEGLGTDDELHPIQREFVNEFAVQCGYCIPGFLCAGAALLDEYPDPTDDQIRLAFSGNLCRCTGYYPMFDAVHAAANG